MTREDSRKRRDRLAAASDRAAKQADLHWADHGKRQAEPGDLYVLRETSELPIEWVLLERNPDNPQLFLAVPADTCPLVGNADLALSEEGARGPLTLRCQAKVWLHEETLDPDLYTGALDARAVERAREIVRQAGERKIEPGPEEARPAYRDWIQEVIAPAQATVGNLVPHSLPHRRRSRSPFRFYAAASILLGIAALGMGSWALWQQSRIARLSQERAAVEERLSREREQSAAAQDDLAAALREKERLEREVRQSEMRGEDAPEPLVNLPLAFLDPAGSLRTQAEPLHFPPEAPYLVLALQLPEGSDAPAYRVILHRGGTVVWRSDPFPSADSQEIRLALPRRLLSPGEYELRLHSSRDGRERRLADYDLRIAP